MSYIALYRKFRPNSFDEVKGQDHIVTTLKNQITNNRIGHAYLFCGTRGTGKTSVAKIFAKAVNCNRTSDGNPCGECETCRSIQNTTSMDVVEIDAASNNGVDNIRQIIDEVQYSPTSGRFKVYIIDEVHMLSIGAFNALLKTLEEPPAYVIFILATTEVHKIPITILSRCQRYDFRRLTAELITQALAELAVKEGIDFEEKALKHIARTADGSMRDAISLFDQCISFYLNEPLTYEHVLGILGAVDTEVFTYFTEKLINRDAISCINRLDRLVMKGVDISQFVLDYTWYLRNMMLLKTSDEVSEELLSISAEKLDALKTSAGSVSMEILLRYIRILSELSNNLKYTSQKRITVETALIKMAVPQMENDMGSILERLNILEGKLEKGIPMVQADQLETGPKLEKSSKPKPVLPQAGIEDVKYVVDNWGKLVRHLEGGLKVCLGKAKLSAKEENTLLMVFSDSYACKLVEKEAEYIKNIIRQEIGKQIHIETKQLETEERFEDHYAEIRSKINIPIIVEEEE
ncbi:DNA polymerase III subunit gamma/tau [Parasporobacterium paucivorans]|uniref:DNA-directed DNA polymerase n=1 Tax=Parasporobacterium paucivorans DSM 15970 TaxID=1122934 RepID=A0A1M6BCH7_9FIRM|nr:DNA polymerase III subunit gamma/tau [Parasporobacterium paucivorans]SHI46450.1 DNA polymerase-3 subunit gamma/tau [Parasporobacterium paucivorans DSM 15970]